MTGKNIIATLALLIDRIDQTSGADRTILCMAINSILDELDTWARTSDDAKHSHPNIRNVHLPIIEMRGPLHCLSGLSDAHSDTNQCIVWLTEGIKTLSGQTCLSLYPPL